MKNITITLTLASCLLFLDFNQASAQRKFKDYLLLGSTSLASGMLDGTTTETPKEQPTTNTNTDTKVTNSTPPAIVYYKIQDPDGYSNLRQAPNGTVIKKVTDQEKFEVIGTEGKFKKVKLSDGTVGFISESRVIQIK